MARVDAGDRALAGQVPRPPGQPTMYLLHFFAEARREYDIQHEFERAAESFPVSVWVISLDVANDPIRGDVSRPETIRF
eukprot:1552935-Pyramimonas_sp.AAC.1